MPPTLAHCMFCGKNEISEESYVLGVAHLGGVGGKGVEILVQPLKEYITGCRVIFDRERPWIDVEGTRGVAQVRRYPDMRTT